MTGAYVANKDLSGLVYQMTIRFRSHWYILVYVWRDETSLRANTNFKRDDHVGAYVAYPGRLKTRGKFGEIHLVRELIGAGYVSHELQHFLFDWFFTVEWTRNINEKMADLAGEVTRKFWNQYYESEEGVDHERTR